jgi:hypothetical protein
MPRKIYCGEQEDLPQGYTHFGTRLQCLRRGYGAALVYSTDEERRRAIIRMTQNPNPNIGMDKFTAIAKNLRVDPYRANGRLKSRITLIQDIVEKLESLL